MKGQRTRGRFGINTNKTLRRMTYNGAHCEWNCEDFMSLVEAKLLNGEGFETDFKFEPRRYSDSWQFNYEQQQRERNALRKPLCPDCKRSFK
jgi:hypothetical protein